MVSLEKYNKIKKASIDILDKNKISLTDVEKENIEAVGFL